MECIMPAVAVIETLATRYRSLAKKHGETLKHHELMGYYFTEVT